ncbi:MAG: hypothetical protein K0S33_2483 [Bacteroidetes bacterium]|jgi:hypothetical protein|nr:hypothetical protein [Bacteroidota bacterium]
MLSITANQIIRRTISENEEANPFSDDFNLEKLHELLKLDLEHYAKTHTIIDEKVLPEIIEIIIQLNEIYEELMSQIETLLEEINLKEISLIEEILSLTNFDYLNLISEQRKNLISNTDLHFDFSRSIKTKNIFGENIDIQDAVDTSTDVCNELINFIIGFNIQTDTKAKPHTPKERSLLIRKLMMTTNLLVNIKTAIEFYRKEFGDLTKEDGIIKFKNYPIGYSALKTVGKQRESNLIQEASIYASKLPNKTINIPKFSIEKGTIYISNLSAGKEEIFREFFSSVQTTFYFHLHLKPLKFDGSITINDVFNFLVSIRSFLQTINGSIIIDTAIKTQNLSSVPIKIDKKRLIKYLQKTTSLKEKNIEALLSSISQPFSGAINFWKKPLINFKSSYYFLFAPLAHGHLTYQVDNSLDKVITADKQEKYFSELLVLELSHNIKNGYKFKKVDTLILNKLGEQSKTLLVYETINTLIVIEICLFTYCIDSDDYSIAMEKLGKAAERMHKTRQIIENNLTQVTDTKIEDITCVIVTNHTSLSGLNIEGIFVLDSHLLTNYLKVGEFKKGVVVYEGKKTHSQELSSFKYYDSEKEFCANFRNFCIDPVPIHETIKRLKAIEVPIVHKDMSTQIHGDGFEFVPIESSFWSMVNEVEYFLKQLYYFEKSLIKTEARTHIEKQLSYLLPQVFRFISTDSSNRGNRIEVVKIFKATKVFGMSQLIFSLNGLIKELTKKNIEKDNSYTSSKIDIKKAEEHLAKLFSENSSTKASLSTLEFNHSLQEKDLENLIEYLVEALSVFNPRYCTEEELENNYFILSVFTCLSKGNEKHKKNISAGCLNLVDLLNYNHHYQKARDLSEEILEFSFKNEKLPVLGWYCLFRCYVKQNNVFDAAFYGCLYISTLLTSPHVYEYQIIDALYNGMLFFRDFGYNQLSENIYEALKPLKLDEYDRHKITLSHFNSKLTGFIDSIEGTLEEAEEFLSKNIDSILKYGQKGALPWIAFIYNLKILHSKELIKDISPFETFFTKLAQNIDKETLDSLEGAFFPLDITTKKIYKDSLAKIFETRNIEDFTSELGKLELLAENVASLSIKPLDIDNLLLSGIVLNDNTLTFIAKESDPEGTSFVSKELTKTLNRISIYSTEIVSKLNLRKGQLFCWIFHIHNNTYTLTINPEKNAHVKKLSKWSITDMTSWLKNISKFYFDDKGDYPINMQEQDYEKTLRDLSFANIEIEEQFDELLLSCSLSLSTFPHNLIQNSINIKKNTEYHEDLIKGIVKTEKIDFISYHSPITNVISLEWFVNNCITIELKKSEISLEAWIPIIDEDIVLIIGHEKLKPVIEMYHGTIHTAIVPEQALSSTINIFLAHGGKGVEGFRTLYTKHSEGHAYIKQGGIERLFGKGIIAVLFVCNSASISQEIYAQKLVAFTHEILALGYQAVIAPAWGLNPDISGVWLARFIELIKEGVYISEAVQAANVKISKEGYNEYHGFYTPTGWAAMHIYGNPNIIFKE